MHELLFLGLENILFFSLNDNDQSLMHNFNSLSIGKIFFFISHELDCGDNLI